MEMNEEDTNQEAGGEMSQTTWNLIQEVILRKLAIPANSGVQNGEGGRLGGAVAGRTAP